MARKTDRRVERTHQLLRSALMSLIREKGFEALTVQNIIDRANVGRATFYAHFDNKEDLLVSGFEDLRASLRQRQREALSGRGSVDERAFAFSHEMFAHANEYRDVFRAMVGKQSGAVVQQILHQMLVELVREDMKAMAARSEAGSLPGGDDRAVCRRRPFRTSDVVAEGEDAAVSRGDQRVVPPTCHCGAEGGAAIVTCGDRNPLGSPGEVGERADGSRMTSLSRAAL
jgi:AcrR family transcriptional regulator